MADHVESVVYHFRGVKRGRLISDHLVVDVSPRGNPQSEQGYSIIR